MDKRDKPTLEPSGELMNFLLCRLCLSLSVSLSLSEIFSPRLIFGDFSGTIDPAVNGGISNYQCFLDGSYRVAHPEIAENVDSTPEKQKIIEQLRASLYEQLQLLDEGMKLHSRKCLSEMRPLHNHLTLRYQEMNKNLKRLLEE
jgi:hypothetical protein